MKNVLLIIPQGVRPKAGVQHALERAAESKSKLIAVAVLDPQETARIASRLDSAFMGERVGDRVTEALAREQRVHAECVLESIGRCAEHAGVDLATLVETGDTTEVCERVIRDHDIGYAVLLSERPSWLTRLLSRSSAVKIPAFEGCEIKVIEETDDDLDPDEGVR